MLYMILKYPFSCISH